MQNVEQINRFKQGYQNRVDALIGFLYSPGTHFEPLLLFLLGVGLLSIVTGIKMMRSKRLHLPVDTSGQITADATEPIHLPMPENPKP
ncbi:MAG: hypothetical protein AB1757_10840 [Acidobacteriota bacterium]